MQQQATCAAVHVTCSAALEQQCPAVPLGPSALSIQQRVAALWLCGCAANTYAISRSGRARALRGGGAARRAVVRVGPRASQILTNRDISLKGKNVRARLRPESNCGTENHRQIAFVSCWLAGSAESDLSESDGFSATQLPAAWNLSQQQAFS
jgi:hypothetical protein